MLEINTLIVGAGPAGLAVAARLKKMGLNYQLWEASDQVANSWTRHYDRLHLHTVKEQSQLPYLEFPKDYPRFVSRDQLLEYLQDYARNFNLQPKFGKKLKQVVSSNGKWLVFTEENEKYLVENLIIATGLNNTPRLPKWPGMESFKPPIIHSRDYRNARKLPYQKCLVVGMGNTGAEIALDLAENNIETYISVRSPLNIVPRQAFGRPTQQTALKLQMLPTWLQDFLGNLLKKITIGNLDKYGIKIRSQSPLQQLRETGKTPLIDLGTVNMIKKGHIKVLPDIVSFSENTVHFNNGKSYEMDALICATGYQSGISRLIPEIKSYLDRYGNPKFPIGTGRWSGLYFLGFNNFRPGGVLGIINEDSEQIAKHIKHYRTPLNQVI